MTKDEALKMAIEAMIFHTEQTRPLKVTAVAIQACKEALAEQPTTQEPVAWMNDIAFSMEKDELTADKFGDIIPLYTHPKEWQGLSDEKIKLVITTALDINVIDITKEEIVVAYAIEAKLKEKNNG